MRDRLSRILVAAAVMLGVAATDCAKAGRPPSVTIGQPVQGEMFPVSSHIAFEGTADDKKDGDLTSEMVWTSDLAGTIGTGGSFSTPLPAGEHQITAAVVNSAGKSRHDSVIITVASTLRIADVSLVVPADPEQAPKYEKVELLIAIEGVTATRFYDADPARGGLDLSATFVGPNGTWTVPGFYDGANWRVRFAPDAVGDWSFSLAVQDGGGPDAWDGGSFACVASPHPGWARLRGGRVELSEGDVVFGAGHNTGWQYNDGGVEQPPLAEMAARGENLLSFWLATPWAQPSFEWSGEPLWAERSPIENSEGHVGNYNQSACAYVDGVIARAESAGIYLLPTIWTHGQLRDDNHPWGSGWWYNNAYNEVCSVVDFFDTAGTEQWRLQRNFYRYLIARWGYSRAVVGWVGLCEIEGTTGYRQSPSLADAWCVAVRDYFRANDPFRTGADGRYPVAFTKVDTPGWGDGDMRATDSYSRQREDVAVAAAIAGQTVTMRVSGKPCFHAEFGGDIVGGASQPAHLHNGIWPGAAAGATFTPLVWCDGGNFPMLTPAMQDHLQALSRFMAAIDYLGRPDLDVEAVDVAPPCRGWATKSPDRGWAWIQNEAGNMGGQVVSVSGLIQGSYTVEWYDVWTSSMVPLAVGPATVDAGGTLYATTPALARADIACKFFRAPNDAPIAHPDAYATNEDEDLAVSAPGVLSNDQDSDGPAPMTALLDASPADGSVVLYPDGSFSYTPRADFTGTDSFTYRSHDGLDNSDAATVAIAVHFVNDAPVAGDDSAVTQVGVPVVMPVLENDTDADGDTLSVATLLQGGHGLATINEDQTVTYAPDPGFMGEDSFWYTVTDGRGGTDTATVSVSISAASTASIHGWVADAATGSGAHGVSVKLEKAKNRKRWRTLGTAATDTQGYYEFSGLDAGRYRVTPLADARQFVPASATVLFEAPGDFARVDFTMSQ